MRGNLVWDICAFVPSKAGLAKEVSSIHGGGLSKEVSSIHGGGLSKEVSSIHEGGLSKEVLLYLMYMVSRCVWSGVGRVLPHSS